MENIAEPSNEQLAPAQAERLLDLMRALGRRNSLRDPLSMTIEALEFTGPQLHALMWVGGDGSLTMGELAQRVGITVKTITGIVDRLEARHLVERERDPSDRRVVRVHLTPSGQEIYQQFEQQVRDRVTAFLAFLPPEDAQALIRISERLVERMSALPQPPVSEE